MRIAWLGPFPGVGGGVDGMGTVLLEALIQTGMVEIDAYFVGDEGQIPEILRNKAGLRIFCENSSWQWGRWYSRNPLLAFITGQLDRARLEKVLVTRMVNNHKQAPYDVIHQFSHIELFFNPQRFPGAMVVLHPEVHAQGELNWMRKESSWAKRLEPFWKRKIAQAILWLRLISQRHSVRLADGIVCPSPQFLQDLCRDYLKSPTHAAIIPNPIAMTQYMVTKTKTDKALHLLFVSRISVRKGVEMLVELSQRLDDLVGEIDITVIGGHTQWSDYRILLQDLNPRIARYQGGSSNMKEWYEFGDILLQPAHYEPFGLTVGEALASGLPVVASEAVGASAGVNSAVMRVFPVGDVDAFETQVRKLIRDMKVQSERDNLRKLSRMEAEKRFDPEIVARQLLEFWTQSAKLNGLADTRVKGM